MRLLFIDRRDLPVVWGHTRIEATPLRHMTDLDAPPFQMALATEGEGGRWDVLGYRCGKRTPWQLWRASTARRQHLRGPRASSWTRTTIRSPTARTGSTWRR